MKTPALLVASLLLAAAATAADPTPPVPSSASEIKLTNRSSFAPDSATKRSPFLPVGYVRKTAEVVVAKEFEVRPEMFTITAILLGNPPLAIINGKDRGVGDKIPLNASGSEFVTVKRIEDGQVILLHKAKEVTVQAGRRK